MLRGCVSSSSPAGSRGRRRRCSSASPTDTCSASRMGRSTVTASRRCWSRVASRWLPAARSTRHVCCGRHSSFGAARRSEISATSLGPAPRPSGWRSCGCRLVELRLEADLALGRHAELVGELEALVAEHPLRERPRGPADAWRSTVPAGRPTRSPPTRTRAGARGRARPRPEPGAAGARRGDPAPGRVRSPRPPAATRRPVEPADRSRHARRPRGGARRRSGRVLDDPQCDAQPDSARAGSARRGLRSRWRAGGRVGQYRRPVRSAGADPGLDLVLPTVAQALGVGTTGDLPLRELSSSASAESGYCSCSTTSSSSWPRRGCSGVLVERCPRRSSSRAASASG